MDDYVWSMEKNIDKKYVPIPFIDNGEKSKCTQCGGDATIAMISWKDETGKQYYKKNERLCMMCHRKRTGQPFF